MSKKKHIGKPKFSADDLIDDWQEIALDAYSKGKADVQVRILLARPGFRILGNSTWTRLMESEEYTLFAETIKKGRLLSEAWWVNEGQMGLRDQKFNTALYFIQMKNRFRWKDKQPDEVPQITQVSQTASISPEKLLDALEKFGKK